MKAKEELWADLGRGERAPVYLLVGDEFLVRKDAEELVSKLLPESLPGLNYSVLDGASAFEVAQDLATMPLLAGVKVVLARDPDFLAPKKGRGEGLAKAKEAWRAGRRKEAARRLLPLLAKAGWGPGDLDFRRGGTLERLREELNLPLEEADVAFLEELAAYCREEKLFAPDSDAGALVALLERGLPPGQVLVLTATEVDPKSPLVRWALEHGRVLERGVATRLKDLDLSEIAREVLAPFGKHLSPRAEAVLKDRAGANMRLVQSELEKLALYAQGPTIEAGDVELLVARVRDEEYLDLSDALQKKDLAASLKTVGESLAQGSHPLQLLGAIASQVRSLLENHERAIEFTQGAMPRSFDDFKERVFPRVEQEALQSKQRVPHPYAAFMAMRAAGKFTRGQLLKDLVACADADLAIKSSANGKLVIERLLWTLAERA